MILALYKKYYSISKLSFSDKKSVLKNLYRMSVKIILEYYNIFIEC